MRLVRFGGAGLNVARQADLQRNLPVIHILRQLGVLEQPGSVSDPVGAALVNRLLDRSRAVSLSRVNGHRQIVVARVRECPGVIRRRIAGFPAGEIERHHSVALEIYRQPRKLQRDLGREMAERADDESPDDSKLLLRPREPAHRRLHHLRQREASLTFSTGAFLTSMYITPSRNASAASSYAILSSASSVCITEIVTAKRARYSSRFAADFTCM